MEKEMETTIILGLYWGYFVHTVVLGYCPHPTSWIRIMMCIYADHMTVTIVCLIGGGSSQSSPFMLTTTPIPNSKYVLPTVFFNSGLEGCLKSIGMII